MARTLEQINEDIRSWEAVQEDYARRDLDDAAQNVWTQHLSPLFQEMAEVKAETLAV